MTRSVARASGLQDAAERAPRHSVERFGDDQIVRITTRGFIVFEPDTVHGTIIAGFVVSQAKRFLVGPMENYRPNTVTGPLNTSYTVVSKAESPGTQFAGTLLESVYARGRDALVTIGPSGPRRLPKVFVSTARNISQNLQTNTTSVSELSGRWTLDIPASLASNTAHESFDSVVTSFVSGFIASGYSQVTLTPAN